MPRRRLPQVRAAPAHARSSFRPSTTASSHSSRLACRNALATPPTHSLASVTGSRSGTTSSSGNIIPNIVVCPLVYLSGRSTQPWHVRVHASVRERARPPTPAHAHSLTLRSYFTRAYCLLMGVRACASKIVRARALTHAISHMHTQPGTVKLTPPSPDTCYGAAVMIDMMLG